MAIWTVAADVTQVSGQEHLGCAGEQRGVRRSEATMMHDHTNRWQHAVERRGPVQHPDPRRKNLARPPFAAEVSRGRAS
jgi:hypothetical protein